MAALYRTLVQLLREAGCRFQRQGKGSHEIWFSPDYKPDFHSTVKSTTGRWRMRS